MLAIEPSTRTVTVGPRDRLAVHRILTGPATWCGPVPSSPARLLVQWRAHGPTRPASLAVAADGALTAELEVPAEAVAPGQSLVLYDGDRVIGSAPVAVAVPLPAPATVEPAGVR